MSMKATLTLLTALLLMPAAALHSADASKPKPNIILFISDDHGWRDSGVYGDPVARTPNMDQLATEGMLFILNSSVERRD
jgi:N-sulfoglucosamine sulfohydrolase